jgi:hypothetical protein
MGLWRDCPEGQLTNQAAPGNWFLALRTCGAAFMENSNFSISI